MVYKCLRGSSDVEAWHQTLEMLLEPFNSGERHFINCLTLLRHAYNVRRSELHRPNFPKIGHLEFNIIDQIQCIAQAITGRQTIPNWSVAAFVPASPEAFGICPVISSSEYEDVSDQNLAANGIFGRDAFLAKRMRQLCPTAPVQTKEEKALFREKVGGYVGLSNLRVSNDPDFDQMARDWNSGGLGVVPSVQLRIYKKVPAHFKNYFKIFYRALIRRSITALGNQASSANSEETTAFEGCTRASDH
jgi:hypothetical protein